MAALWSTIVLKHRQHHESLDAPLLSSADRSASSPSVLEPALSFSRHTSLTGPLGLSPAALPSPGLAALPPCARGRWLGVAERVERWWLAAAVALGLALARAPLLFGGLDLAVSLWGYWRFVPGAVDSRQDARAYHYDPTTKAEDLVTLNLLRAVLCCLCALSFVRTPRRTPKQDPDLGSDRDQDRDQDQGRDPDPSPNRGPSRGEDEIGAAEGGCLEDPFAPSALPACGVSSGGGSDAARQGNRSAEEDLVSRRSEADVDGRSLMLRPARPAQLDPFGDASASPTLAYRYSVENAWQKAARSNPDSGSGSDSGSPCGGAEVASPRSRPAALPAPTPPSLPPARALPTPSDVPLLGALVLSPSPRVERAAQRRSAASAASARPLRSTSPRQGPRPPEWRWQAPTSLYDVARDLSPSRADTYDSPSPSPSPPESSFRTSSSLFGGASMDGIPSPSRERSPSRGGAAFPGSANAPGMGEGTGAPRGLFAGASGDPHGLFAGASGAPHGLFAGASGARLVDEGMPRSAGLGGDGARNAARGDPAWSTTEPGPSRPSRSSAPSAPSDGQTPLSSHHAQRSSLLQQQQQQLLQQSYHLEDGRTAHAAHGALNARSLVTAATNDETGAANAQTASVDAAAGASLSHAQSPPFSVQIAGASRPAGLPEQASPPTPLPSPPPPPLPPSRSPLVYSIVAAACAAATAPSALAKAALVSQSTWTLVPGAEEGFWTYCALSFACAFLHVLVAQLYARRERARAKRGLRGSRPPWAEGELEWVWKGLVQGRELARFQLLAAAAWVDAETEEELRRQGRGGGGADPTGPGLVPAARAPARPKRLAKLFRNLDGYTNSSSNSNSSNNNGTGNPFAALYWLAAIQASGASATTTSSTALAASAASAVSPFAAASGRGASRDRLRAPFAASRASSSLAGGSPSLLHGEWPFSRFASSASSSMPPPRAGLLARLCSVWPLSWLFGGAGGGRASAAFSSSSPSFSAFSPRCDATGASVFARMHPFGTWNFFWNASWGLDGASPREGAAGGTGGAAAGGGAGGNPASGGRHAAPSRRAAAAQALRLYALTLGVHIGAILSERELKRERQGSEDAADGARAGGDEPSAAASDAAAGLPPGLGPAVSRRASATAAGAGSGAGATSGPVPGPVAGLGSGSGPYPASPLSPQSATYGLDAERAVVPWPSPLVQALETDLLALLPALAPADPEELEAAVPGGGRFLTDCPGGVCIHYGLVLPRKPAAFASWGRDVEGDAGSTLGGSTQGREGDEGRFLEGPFAGAEMGAEAGLGSFDPDPGACSEATLRELPYPGALAGRGATDGEVAGSISEDVAGDPSSSAFQGEGVPCGPAGGVFCAASGSSAAFDPLASPAPDASTPSARPSLAQSLRSPFSPEAARAGASEVGPRLPPPLPPAPHPSSPPPRPPISPTAPPPPSARLRASSTSMTPPDPARTHALAKHADDPRGAPELLWVSSSGALAGSRALAAAAHADDFVSRIGWKQSAKKATRVRDGRDGRVPRAGQIGRVSAGPTPPSAPVGGISVSLGRSSSSSGFALVGSRSRDGRGGRSSSDGRGGPLSAAVRGGRSSSEGRDSLASAVAAEPGASREGGARFTGAAGASESDERMGSEAAWRDKERTSGAEAARGERTAAPRDAQGHSADGARGDRALHARGEGPVSKDASLTARSWDSPAWRQSLLSTQDIRRGIILLHAFDSSATAWRDVSQLVADAAGVPVAAVDLPGSGLSTRPKPRSRTTAPRRASGFGRASSGLLGRSPAPQPAAGSGADGIADALESGLLRASWPRRKRETGVAGNEGASRASARKSVAEREIGEGESQGLFARFRGLFARSDGGGQRGRKAASQPSASLAAATAAPTASEERSLATPSTRPSTPADEGVSASAVQTPASRLRSPSSSRAVTFSPVESHASIVDAAETGQREPAIPQGSAHPVAGTADQTQTQGCVHRCSSSQAPIPPELPPSLVDRRPSAALSAGVGVLPAKLWLPWSICSWSARDEEDPCASAFLARLLVEVSLSLGFDKVVFVGAGDSALLAAAAAEEAARRRREDVARVQRRQAREGGRVDRDEGSAMGASHDTIASAPGPRPPSASPHAALPELGLARPSSAASVASTHVGRGCPHALGVFVVRPATDGLVGSRLERTLARLGAPGRWLLARLGAPPGADLLDPRSWARTAHEEQEDEEEEEEEGEGEQDGWERGGCDGEDGEEEEEESHAMRQGASRSSRRTGRSRSIGRDSVRSESGGRRPDAPFAFSDEDDAEDEDEDFEAGWRGRGAEREDERATRRVPAPRPQRRRRRPEPTAPALPPPRAFESARLLAAAAALPGAAEARAGRLAASSRVRRAARRRLCARLAAEGVRVAGAVGALDRRLPPPLAASAAGELGAAYVAALPDAGSHLEEEAPEALAEEIAEFARACFFGDETLAQAT